MKLNPLTSKTICGNCDKRFEGLMSFIPAHACKAYKVNIGPRRNVYFSSLEAAQAFCAEVFSKKNIVLSIVATKS